MSDLERGINRTARKDTAVLLADAMRGFLIAHGHWDQATALNAIARAGARWVCVIRISA